MEDSDWQPLSVEAAARLLDDADFRWWISGGHVFELHLEDQWRSHEDLDVGVCRYQVDAAVAWFDGWDIHAAHGGCLTPWESAQRVEKPNNVWLRPNPTKPWALDLTVGEGTDTQWVYRRDSDVRRPWSAAVLRTSRGIPYLAPELQLLFKSTHLREKDWMDARRVIPRLEEEQRSFLRTHLVTNHPWQDLLG